MTISHKLIALAASAAVLVTGATAAIATTLQTPPQVVAATPAVVPTEVRVWADTTTHVVALNEPTVAQALAAAHITLAETDRVSPAAETVLSLGDVVTVNRVSVAQESKQVTLEFAITEVKDKTLAKGERKVKTKGVAGVRTDVTETVTVDGAVESTRTVSQTVTTAPVNQVVLVGTKVATPAPTTTTTRTDVTSRSAVRTAPKAPSAPSAPAEPADPAPAGGAINLARADMWDRIAKCESSGNWAINTGNGYYGGLQFNLATWRSVGGTDFAAYPHQASRAEQITVANRLYAQRGLQPWGCRHAA